MKNQKIYKIQKTYRNRETFIEGTLAELIKYFGYTLEVGNSWNKKINRNPKTIKSFMNNLCKSYDEKEGGYERTSIELV